MSDKQGGALRNKRGSALRHAKVVGEIRPFIYTSGFFLSQTPTQSAWIHACQNAHVHGLLHVSMCMCMLHKQVHGFSAAINANT